MSIQAVAWVLAQKGEDLPGTARLIMIALANHADHVNGHCFPTTKRIADEAGCDQRTVKRYLPALVRNGFIDSRRRRSTEDGEFRANDYWLLFGRQPSPWQYFNKRTEDDPEPQDVDPGDLMPPGENDENAPSGGVENGQELHGMSPRPGDTRVPSHIIEQPSLLEPSYAGLVEAAVPIPPVASDAPPQGLVPKEAIEKIPIGFDPKEQAEQKRKLDAAEEARKAKPIFVWVGSDAWKAWVAHKSRETGKPWHLTTTAFVNGNSRLGWWFPQLWPPPVTKPPDGLSPSDAAVLSKELMR